MRIFIHAAAAAMLAAMQALRSSSPNSRRGPGTRSCSTMLKPSKYDGEALRAIRACNGVGRPVRRAA